MTTERGSSKKECGRNEAKKFKMLPTVTYPLYIFTITRRLRSLIAI